MHNNKFSKETLWAVSILLTCFLTGCFLFFKIPCETIHFANAHAIILQNIDNPVSKTEATIPYSFDSHTNVDHSKVSTLTAEITDTNYHSPIEFESLWEINKDIYAWITIPGTIIDYPILQHKTDNSYYLNYNIDGTKGFPGCIYTENITSKDFTDNNTVIYGHNLRNGEMFTDLHKFRDAEFFKENDTVYIYTPQKQLTYKIFAAYLYDDRHLMNSFDFSDREIYSYYLFTIQNMNSKDINLRKEIKITDTDKIITLITCIRENPEKRVYVQAVLQP